MFLFLFRDFFPFALGDLFPVYCFLLCYCFGFLFGLGTSSLLINSIMYFGFPFLSKNGINICIFGVFIFCHSCASLFMVLFSVFC